MRKNGFRWVTAIRWHPDAPDLRAAASVDERLPAKSFCKECAEAAGADGGAGFAAPARQS
jgi:hypothetical protein